MAIPTLPGSISEIFLMLKMWIAWRHRLIFRCATISGVNASLLVWRATAEPTRMMELWRYHNEDDQEWVRQSLTGAHVIPDAMAPKNQIFTLDLIYQSDSPDF
jgi:hypothetical protein